MIYVFVAFAICAMWFVLGIVVGRGMHRESGEVEPASEAVTRETPVKAPASPHPHKRAKPDEDGQR